MMNYEKQSMIIVDLDETLIKENSTEIILRRAKLWHIFRVLRFIVVRILRVRGNAFDRLMVELALAQNINFCNLEMTVDHGLIDALKEFEYIIVTHASKRISNYLPSEIDTSRIKFTPTKIWTKTKSNYAHLSHIIITDDIVSDSKGFTIAIDPRLIDADRLKNVLVTLLQ